MPGSSPSAPSATAEQPSVDGGSTGLSQDPLRCGPELQLGATPLQRLTRSQYANAVRDLLHVPFDLSLLSEDEKVGVFDGNTIAPVADLQVEQFAVAAERSARAALAKLESLVPCDRAKMGDAACATLFVQVFGLRAYRRPLSSDEQTSYRALYDAFKGLGHAEALRVIVQTMLQTPSYLYHLELTPATPGNGPVAPLDAYELASRLSFFLHNSTPDDQLLEAARAGLLSDPQALAKEAERLLALDRAADTMASFHVQWLELGKLESVSKDATLYPSFDKELAAAMRNETVRFADYVLRKDDAKLETLLTAAYSFPEGPLRALYGLKAEPMTPAAAPVALDPAQRGGLLTQPSFLTVHAHYNQSSPVQRGKVVIRNLLCASLPDPPPNVSTTPPEPSPTATTRQRLTQHQDNPACTGCHKRIDGIGLGFEQYDAIGAFRRMEANQVIDPSGQVLGTKDINGAFTGVVDLAHKLSQSSDVQHCVTKQWFRYALGRVEADADGCTLADLYKKFDASGHDIRALLKSIVLSDAFRSKRAVSGAP